MVCRVSPKRMAKIDHISYVLWKKCVEPYVRRSIKRTKALRLALERGPSPNVVNPVIQKIIKKGKFNGGMDGFNAAMMTFSYLAAVCRYHEYKLRQQRKDNRQHKEVLSK